MKKLIFSVLPTVAIATTSFAQENQLNASFSPRVWLNNKDVYHDDFMNDALYSTDQLGASIDIAFKRITRSGLTYGAGIDFGRYSEKVSIQYNDLSNFREDGQFDGVSFSKGIDAKFVYTSIGAFIGYEYNLNKHATSSIAAEFGIKKMLPFTGFMKESIPLYAKSNVDNKDIEFGTYDWASGNVTNFFRGPVLFEGALTYNFSLGSTKRQFFVGVIGTINAFFFNAPGGDGRIQQGNFVLVDYTTEMNGIRHYGTPNKTYYEVIANKYTSIGLKMGMNLFRF